MPRLVLFTHLPKTAGRSLQSVIRANHGQGELAECYGTPRDPEWYRLWWHSMPPEQRDALACVSGHGTPHLVPHLDRPYRGLCVLRHPLERVLSLHRFMASRYERRRERPSLGPRGERGVPARLARSGDEVEDIFARRARDPGARTGYGMFFDGQTRLLAAAHPDVELPESYGPETTDEELAGPVRRLVERMERDWTVGIHDRLAESFELFGRACGWRTVFLPHRNAGVGRPPQDLSVEARELVLAHNRLDLALYEHFSGELDATLRRAGRVVSLRRWVDARRGKVEGSSPPAQGRPKVRHRGRITACERRTPSMLSVTGWALLAGSTVARVEVMVDGRRVGLARLGLHRGSVGRRHPEAPSGPISGFALDVDLDELPGSAGPLLVAATAVGTDGARRVLRAVRVPAEAPAPRPAEGRAGRAATLRARGKRLAGLSFGDRDPRESPLLLVFTHDLRRAGAQLHLVETLERLVGGGRFDATVVSGEDGPLRARFEALGAEVHLCGDFGFDGVEAYEGRMQELLAWCAPLRADVVLANTLPAFPGVDLAGRLGLPSAFVVHESAEFARWSSAHDDWIGGHGYPRERAEKALAEASLVLFPSATTRNQYAHLGDPERFLTLPIGIELEPIDDYRRACGRDGARGELGLGADEVVVLALGTFQPRKAQAPLAQAFALIADRHPSARLCLVGDTGDAYSDSVRLFAARAGLEDRVSIVAVVDDVRPWHAAADLVVIASDRESLPRVALEAMAFETPVAGTAVFGMPDLLRGGQAGDLCPPRDVAALADMLDRALGRGPEERARMVDAASEVVRGRHDARHHAEALAALLTGLVGQPAPRTSERAAA